MKNLIKVIAVLLNVVLIMSASACSLFGSASDDNSNKTLKPFTVNYYEGKTVTYTPSKGDKSIQTNFVAPSGKVILGLFDENDIQYADYDCVVDLKNQTVPSILYAKYENVDISYLEEDPFRGITEDPRAISFYTAFSLTWEFNATEEPNDKKMISACMCNPYADINITVSFMAKGMPSTSSQCFISQLIINDDVVGEFRQATFRSDLVYNTYTYNATIKAKLLTNGDYKVKIKTTSKLGSKDYTVKNYKIDFKFNFAS